MTEGGIFEDALSGLCQRWSQHAHMKWGLSGCPNRGCVAICTCMCLHEPLRAGCTDCPQMDVCRCEGILGRELIEVLLEGSTLHMTKWDEYAKCGRKRRTTTVRLDDPDSLRDFLRYLKRMVKNSGVRLAPAKAA